MPSMKEIEKRADEAYSMALEARNKIDSHEKVCELRYQGIQSGVTTIVSRLDKTNSRIWWAAGMVITTCFGIIGFLISHHL